jgi:thioredoxin-dependent peroxiredoxin
MRTVLALLLALSIPACRGESAPASSATATDGLVGKPAPEVVATAHDGQAIDTRALKGKHVVLYFYPKDETPGCTKEACAFRDAWKRLESADVQVIGVSTNSATSHEDFQKKQHLPFALASDDGKVGDAYGVTKHVWGFDRVSFLVGRDGKVAHVWPSVDPAIHADDVVKEASRL